ncbi:MAG: tripartite tricarboxylate transporter substrate binding protein [Burkholderiaceae bacterium]
MSDEIGVRRRTLLQAGAALAAQAALPSLSGAQSASFPSQTVRMVVPFPAGGASDLAARQMGQKLSALLGQTVVVDNRPGADGAIASQEVARSAPDGHTIYYATATALTYVPVIRRNPGYALSDFAPLTHFVSYTFFLAVHESVPGRNLAEVLDHVRAHPNKYSYGSGNSSGIIGMAQLLDSSKTEMVHVPYKGEPQASVDLIAGRIHMLIATPAVLPQLMQDGKVRPVCVLLKERSPLMPDVPTIEESGQPLMRCSLWGGFFAPAKTPAPIVDQLSRALRTVMSEPDMKERLQKLGLMPEGDTPEQFAAFLQEQVVAWRDAVALAKIPTDG